jgi:hypothetical protein
LLLTKFTRPSIVLIAALSCCASRAFLSSCLGPASLDRLPRCLAPLPRRHVLCTCLAAPPAELLRRLTEGRLPPSETRCCFLEHFHVRKYAGMQMCHAMIPLRITYRYV